MTHSLSPELIQASQDARANQKSLPESLIGKIKVRPPPPKRGFQHSHIMNDRAQDHPTHGLYSTHTKHDPIPKELPLKEAHEPIPQHSRSFKEKLVDFIM